MERRSMNREDKINYLCTLDRIARCINDEDLFEFWLVYGLPDGDSDNEEALSSYTEEDISDIEEAFHKLLDLAVSQQSEFGPAFYNISDDDFEFAKSYNSNLERC